MFPEWTWIVGFFLGATIGSFLNVVIYRLPRKISLANPSKSFCPNCKHPLDMPDLVPLFSWLASRGKCRYCQVKIAPRYFLVEMLTGALWAGIWWRYFVEGGPNSDWIRGCVYLATAATLVAIIFIDWELYIIPDEINAFLLFLGVLFASITGRWTEFAWGYLVGWGVLWGIAFLGRVAFGKDAMGHGDIKMMRGIGAVIGAGFVLGSIAIAVVAGLVIPLLMLAFRSLKGKGGTSDEPEQAEELAEEYKPEPIKDLVVLGFCYLISLDVVGIFWPALWKQLGYDPESESIEEDDWKPSVTTIPFGPYLAIGAITCMVFPGLVSGLWDSYWKRMTGESEAEKISLRYSRDWEPTVTGSEKFANL